MQAGKWLKANFGKDAAAVAGCVRRVFTGKDGENTLEALRRFCAIYTTTEALDQTGRSDPMRMAALEGRRQVYLFLVGLLEVGGEELTPSEREVDERSQPRPADGPEPEPRYSGTNPALDGYADTGGGDASGGTGSDTGSSD